MSDFDNAPDDLINATAYYQAKAKEWREANALLRKLQKDLADATWNERWARDYAEKARKNYGRMVLLYGTTAVATAFPATEVCDPAATIESPPIATDA